MSQTVANRFLFTLVIVICASTCVSGIFIVYNTHGVNMTKFGFRIKFDRLDMNMSNIKSAIPQNMSRLIPAYKNISKISLDDRCLSGKPLGAAIFQYSPYANAAPFIVGGSWVPAGFDVYGIFPAIMKKAVGVCCHRDSSIRFVKILLSQQITSGDYDFYFPFYGDDMKATSYHDNPFIPIIQAPSVALMVFNDDSKEPKTALIVMTLFKAWPMLIFLLLMAGCSGIIMWCLDHSTNPDNFPETFVKGAWEGFWWAFITMTTVGYGDRFPKSYLGRLFCLLWIIFGIVNISIFTGLITTAFNASTKNHFSIHGAKIGAMSGSEEFKLGISLNADMKAFENNLKSMTALISRKLDGVLIDNFVNMHFGREIVEKSLRVERMIDHPITYGVTLRQNSSYLTGCVRKFVQDNPQEVFEMISESLHSLKNPADKVNRNLKEAEKLFYQSSTLNTILQFGGAFVGALVLGGGLWRLLTHINEKRTAANKFTHHIVKGTKGRHGSFPEIEVKNLIDQYNCFHNGWMSKLKSVHEE